MYSLVNPLKLKQPRNTPTQRTPFFVEALHCIYLAFLSHTTPSNTHYLQSLLTVEVQCEARGKRGEKQRKMRNKKRKRMI